MWDHRFPGAEIAFQGTFTLRCKVNIWERGSQQEEGEKKRQFKLFPLGRYLVECGS
jgi:hypothetical protein